MVTKRKLTDQIKENAVAHLVVVVLGVILGFMSNVGHVIMKQADTETRIVSLEKRAAFLEDRVKKLEFRLDRQEVVTEKRKQLTICGARSIEALARMNNVTLPQCGLFESAAIGGN